MHSSSCMHNSRLHIVLLEIVLLLEIVEIVLLLEEGGCVHQSK